MTEVHRIKLKISNCYLVRGEKNILVDTGSPGEGKKITGQLRKLGVELSDLSLILHTHGHSDHCGSTAELIGYHRIPTAVHTHDRGMTEKGSNGIVKTRGLFAKILKPFVDLPFPPFKPDLHVDDFDDLSSFGVHGRIHHTPGHTEGSVSIELQDGSAIIGDLMMGGFIGGTFLPHLPDYHYFIDDLKKVHRSIIRILKFDADTFHVGHGGPLERKRIEERFKSLLSS